MMGENDVVVLDGIPQELFGLVVLFVDPLVGVADLVEVVEHSLFAKTSQHLPKPQRGSNKTTPLDLAGGVVKHVQLAVLVAHLRKPLHEVLDLGLHGWDVAAVKLVVSVRIYDMRIAREEEQQCIPEAGSVRQVSWTQEHISIG